MKTSISVPLIQSVVSRPTRRDALQALAAFVPKAGKEYTRWRNYDLGPDRHEHVSQLSPYIRSRAVTEPELIRAVLTQHSPYAAEKFIQEVCWRTYWKGWLELHPGIWTSYQHSLPTLLERYKDHPQYKSAVAGDTSSPALNAFARELIDTGYIHNHARMWFASIWIFTLELPWELGADFFFRHLLDGDPASNTLSWRWVAGLQTPGKTYVARATNIETYTEGRLGLNERLQEQPAPPALVDLPAPESLQPNDPPPNCERVAWVMHEEDTSIYQWLYPDSSPPVAVALLEPTGIHRAAGLNPNIGEFRNRLLEDAGQAFEALNVPAHRFDLNSTNNWDPWIRKYCIEAVAWARPSVGLWNAPLAQLRQDLERIGVKVHEQRHPWDDLLYPFATRGYFRFKKQLPIALKAARERIDCPRES